MNDKASAQAAAAKLADALELAIEHARTYGRGDILRELLPILQAVVHPRAPQDLIAIERAERQPPQP